MVHCEVVVAAELKHKRAAADATNTSEKTSTRKVGRQFLCSQPSYELFLFQSLGGDDGIELTGASADDSDAELIRKVLETEVGGTGGLLASFEPFMVGVVSNPSKYSCPVLQTSACLALAKYMMIRFAYAHERDLLTCGISYPVLHSVRNMSSCSSLCWRSLHWSV